MIVTWFPAPHSYTGEDCIEITAHGSPVIVGGILRAAIVLGARQAGPGEFTLRAYVNGRLDLAQAEAVADLSAAVTPRQARAAFAQLEGGLSQARRALGSRIVDVVALLEASLDFPDESYHFASPGDLASRIDAIHADVVSLLGRAGEGCLLRNGATIAITGRPNTGKSSVFNVLLSMDRAIVSSTAGTTRDVLIESFDLNGVPVTLLDTAGRHDTADPVEGEGVRRAEAAVANADLELLVFDRATPLTAADWLLLRQPRQRLIIVNKCDLAAAWDPADQGISPVVEVSARTGEGLDSLRAALAVALGTGSDREPPIVTNERHVALLNSARLALSRAAALSSASEAEELVAFELDMARRAFEDVTGVRTPEDVLRHIFERFCIGK